MLRRIGKKRPRQPHPHPYSARCAVFGEWLLFRNAERPESYLPVNPLVPGGGATIELPPMALRKLVVCPGGEVAAAIVFADNGSCGVAFCRRPGSGSSEWSWSAVRDPPPGAGELLDIALHGGDNNKLYALYGNKTLYAYDLDDDDDGEPECVIADPRPPTVPEVWYMLVVYDTRHYLVPGNDGKKLLLVRSEYGRSFAVFEAVDGRWSEVARLDDDEVLFVSANCSRALPVYGGPGNCVFFVGEPTRGLRFGNFGVYDMATKTIRGAISPLKFQGCHSTGSWLFPSLLP
ncbi:hypothetical protein BRADI_3g02706v3 [Brachypodium distachyon]|uniref:KIB1-4 beta-propeller domain-containing protein n=1 Tax=Brachypodium distachyon TaxID=15368 RepID=A0A2K2CUT7_BRADI|nr:hypothetical protein BRADI_3g02706v3 [Brachypodium distachyon]